MMKSLAIAVSLVALLTVSCKGESKVQGGEAAEGVQTSENAVSYAVDTVESVLNWHGFKINEKTQEEGSHFGTLTFSASNFAVNEGKLESGTFTINMNSLTATDIVDDEESKGKLEGHLKADDFFGVEAFPTAKFEITKVTPVSEGEYNTEIDGNLTIREVTKNYSFQANVSETDSTFSINSNDFMINRQDYNVKFSHAGDNFVKDEMKIQVAIVGKK